MPSSISNVHYDPQEKSLILSSDTETTKYSLVTQESTISATLIPSQELDHPNTDFNIKARIENMKLPEGFEWVVETKFP